MRNVLMVAEKPSIAASIAKFMGGGDTIVHSARVPVHEFKGTFRDQPVTFVVTSVIGHVFNIDFPAKYNNWDKTSAEDLFGAEIVKSEAQPKARIVQHLRESAKGCDYLVLWLDCDLEGENICFEVIECVVPRLNRLHKEQQVFRAKFSSISKPDIDRAMRNLVAPNKNESEAVEARQELDLKIGVTFTRFQTRFFQGKYTGLDGGVISYGPCQTPTLGFCVDRHDEITCFQPEPFWSLDLVVKQSGKKVKFAWSRGRLFDADVARVYETLVKDAGHMTVESVKTSPGKRIRPIPLNTVELLRIASKSLGIGPKDCMYYAEQLYLRGYLSYPRTESTAYPKHFDLEGTVRQQLSHGVWGDFASSLLAMGLHSPRAGVDEGDHPPITPVRLAHPGEFSGGESRIYEVVVRHFLATISPDCQYIATKVVCSGGGGETFNLSGKVITDPGFTLVLSRASGHDHSADLEEGEEEEEEGSIPAVFTEGEVLPIESLTLRQGKTSPPGYLKEHELITRMEKNGIGTDASIPTHMNNIVVRNYVRLGPKRTLVPTNLGIVLCHGYHKIDPDLVLPAIRSNIEKECGLVAKGLAKKEDVVAHTLEIAEAKFMFFASHIETMNALFEATFSPLVESSKPLSKCGKCKKLMKLVKLKPSPKLNCGQCNETYSLPSNGTVKLYMGNTCPLDGFELVQFSLGNKEKALGKTYVICPLCYNHPPFDGFEEGKTMSCDNCVHPSCKFSLEFVGVCACPGDMGEPCTGTMALDQSSYPNWKMCCNTCNRIIRLHGDLHSVKVSRRSVCGDCGSKELILNFSKGKSPLPSGETKLKGCPSCNDLINSMTEVKVGRSKNIELTRGKGKRGRRKKFKKVDIKMTDRF